MIHALKNPALFRSSSRPTSPAPGVTSDSVFVNSGTATERPGRSLNKLTFSSFKRPATPVGTPAPTPAPATLVQDGSYLEALSLKLSEAVSKAILQPPAAATATDQIAGKRPIPPGRGKALCTLIVSELKATRDNAHLYKATLRSLQRPLSVLLNNLSTQLLPLLSSPTFLAPPAPNVQAPNPNTTQLHALAIAGFCGELLSGLDECGLGTDPSLKSVRDGLTSIIGRVSNPLVAGVKAELMPLIEALETPASSTVPKASVKAGPVLHPSIVSLQALMPIYSRAIARYTGSPSSQSTLATFLISVVWKALVALSHRAKVQSPMTSPPSSPALLPSGMKRNRRPSGNSPPATPPASRFSLKLPPTSRPPSPPAVAMTSNVAADARALYNLLHLLPRPPANSEATAVAREAVDEAFSDLQALTVLLENTDSPFIFMNKTEEEVAADLEAWTADLPTVIALPVLLRCKALSGGEGGGGAGAGGHQTPVTAASVASMVGLAEEDYRRGCLSGFGRAEECGPIVTQRVLEGLCAQAQAETRDVVSWLEGRLSAGEP
ncbi:hypothetical protein CONPUDRAFT_101128 [Coniophora puteana RWD-64-598 SS2]|uniref:Uncharacterized protein n=1 Tax=Coniophora puteana (strain RWD-64-598) TaxID=741705 RepID=A0A5M3MUK3_CONPW|nr:uncharacterized protein CONPUDRAFT_101128 [Coniophora puteana RWD-64-598 SS2]EIW82786.1 hypothetical protein CONPUDRAFT_101128 [Coniophora puteana RWD-64-598 SS2]